MTAPLHTFTSHISGKNATVEIYPDRIEWERLKERSGALLVATGGLSLLTKRRKDGSEMIPVKSITSVATKRDGIRNTIVSVITSGNTIDFRVSHDEAAQVRDVLNRLILS